MVGTTVNTMPRRAKEKTVTTRVTAKIGKIIETICFAEGISAADLSSPILEKALRARYLKALDTIQAQRQILGDDKGAKP